MQTNDWCEIVIVSNTWNHLTLCKQMISSKLNYLFDRNTWNNLTVCKKWAQAHLKMLSTKCVHKSYLIYV